MTTDPYDTQDDPARQEQYARHLGLRCEADCPFCAEELAEERMESSWDDDGYAD